MIRVVLDTNIVVSAILQPLGAPSQVFLLAIAEVVQFCVSNSVFAEYEEVIRRPRLERTSEEIERTLEAIREKSLSFQPSKKATACSDLDDNIFLECA